jgi:hypothetical protein
VVVKKHLARRALESGYEVGLLVPYQDGSYYVSEMHTNGYIYSYCLERFTGDPGMLAIKLYRSTCTSPSALMGDKSLINDFNYLNAPGIMGIKLLEDYEKPFFEKRTIPLWVAYQNSAQMKLNAGDFDGARSDLQMANERLLRSLIYPKRGKSFIEVLKENDAILNELFLNNHAEKFAKLFSCIINKISKNEDLVMDQEPLYQQLQAIFNLKIGDQTFQNQLESAIKDIEKYILNPSPQMLEISKALTILDGPHNEDQVTHLGEYEQVASMASENLQQWIDNLLQYAQDCKEDIASKSQDELTLVGHSLGGACAAAGLVHYIVKPERVALPGKKIVGVFFCDPATNKEDNDLFKRFGNAHPGHFKVSLHRRHEAGDIIPTGGQEHLGAAATEQEEDLMLKWLQIDFAIHEALPGAQGAIGASAMVHSTRFEQGIVNKDYKKTSYRPLQQGIFDSRGGIGGPEAYNLLSKELWKMPRVHRVFTEALRVNPNRVMNIARLGLRRVCKSRHVPLSRFFDDKGVMVVKGKEVVTSTPRK